MAGSWVAVPGRLRPQARGSPRLLATITDGQATKEGGYVLRVDWVRALVGLLDAALADDEPCKTLGSVAAMNGRGRERELHVRRWPSAVSVSDDPAIHTGWALRMRDHSEELRDALSRAVEGAALTGKQRQPV